MFLIYMGMTDDYNLTTELHNTDRRVSRAGHHEEMTMTSH